MEQVIRKIVQEELKKALLEIVQPFGVTQDKEEIIYNFDRGRSFGINNLANLRKNIIKNADYGQCAQNI